MKDVLGARIDALCAELDVVRAENAALAERLVECQRKGSRRADQIVGLIDANGKQKYQVRRLEKKLMAIYRYCRAATDDNVVVRKIVAEAIPSRVREYEERNGG